MSTYKNLKVGIGRKYLETKEDPYGTIKVIKEFKHVNDSENVLANVTSFSGIRAAYKDLYGNVVYHICNVDSFTDFDLCVLFATEMTVTDQMIIEDSEKDANDHKFLKDRKTGSIIGIGMVDTLNNVHYFKCNKTNINKDRRILFVKKTFRKFFYDIADSRKGFHTGARIDNSIAYSKKYGVDGNVRLFMAPIKGGTTVTAS